MENNLVFSDTCYIESGANTDYDLSGQGNIECLHLKIIFQFKHTMFHKFY